MGFGILIATCSRNSPVEIPSEDQSKFPFILTTSSGVKIIEYEKRRHHELELSVASDAAAGWWTGQVKNAILGRFEPIPHVDATK